MLPNVSTGISFFGCHITLQPRFANTDRCAEEACEGDLCNACKEFVAVKDEQFTSSHLMMTSYELAASYAPVVCIIIIYPRKIFIS